MTFDQFMQYGVVAVSGVLGWALRELWAAVKSLREDISELERDLPLSYVQKDDYRQDIARVHELLDKIYDKLDGKADRSRP